MQEEQGGKKADKAHYFSAAHPRKSRKVPYWIVCCHNSFITINEIDLVKEQQRCQQLSSNIHLCCCSSRDIPAECIAGVGENDQTILYVRPSDLTPDALAIQADSRASGDRMLDQKTQQQGLDHIGNCANFIVQSPNKNELGKELLQYQQKGADTDKRTEELYNEQGNFDITGLMVIDEMTQRDVCPDHSAKEKFLCTCGKTDTLKETTSHVVFT